MWDANRLVKEGYFYRGPQKEWEFDLYGFYPRGLGDLIYNTMRKIIETDDRSGWAYTSLCYCGDLLDQRMRWPDELDPPFIDGKKPYRKQTDMTRDPYIMWYCACILLNHREYIREVTIPFYLYTPEVWAWRRALLGKLNLYTMWRKINSIFPKKDYVKTLDNYMWTYYHTTQ